VAPQITADCQSRRLVGALWAVPRLCAPGRGRSSRTVSYVHLPFSREEQRAYVQELWCEFAQSGAVFRRALVLLRDLSRGLCRPSLGGVP
jgi:hypothetical protein